MVLQIYVSYNMVILTKLLLDFDIFAGINDTPQKKNLVYSKISQIHFSHIDHCTKINFKQKICVIR